MIFPLANTDFVPMIFSFIVPYFTAFVPDARVDAMPPNVASRPGSTGKNNPNPLLILLLQYLHYYFCMYVCNFM